MRRYFRKDGIVVRGRQAMFGEGSVTSLAVGPGCSVDLTELWDVRGEVYAMLYPGGMSDSARQRIVLVDEDYRRLVWERVREDMWDSLPEGLDVTSAPRWDCREEEPPFVPCAHIGATVRLPSAICEACDVEEGSTLLARAGAHGALWLYPQGAGDAASLGRVAAEEGTLGDAGRAMGDGASLARPELSSRTPSVPGARPSRPSLALLMPTRMAYQLWASGGVDGRTDVSDVAGDAR